MKEGAQNRFNFTAAHPMVKPSFLEAKQMIPDYQSLMRPVLECARNEPRKISDVVEEISDRLGLTDEERQQMLPSGKQTTITNRVHWARSYMKQAGLVRNIRRGWYELTDRGRAVLHNPSISLDAKYLEQFDDFQEFKTRSKDAVISGGVEVEIESETNTPDENLQAAHQKLEAALAANLLDYVRGAAGGELNSSGTAEGSVAGPGGAGAGSVSVSAGGWSFN